MTQLDGVICADKKKVFGLFLTSNSIYVSLLKFMSYHDSEMRLCLLLQNLHVRLYIYFNGASTTHFDKLKSFGTFVFSANKLIK